MAKAPPKSLSGRVVAITGGARGIGRCTARSLIAKGAKVAIGDLDVETAKQTASELGGGSIALPLDVTDLPGFTAFLDGVESELGPLDVLVNNAGIMPIGPLEEEPEHITRKQLEINLHAVIHGTQEAMRRMKPRRTGHIVNIASMAGKMGVPGGATYCATKHAVVGLSEAVRFELRDTGVEVSCVMPGIVNTELASGLQDTRGVKKVEPEDVAVAIVAALEYPRHDVYVPRNGGPINNITRLFPRTVSERIGSWLKADKVLWEHGDRSGYEARAAASAPHVDQELGAGEQADAAAADKQPSGAVSS